MLFSRKPRLNNLLMLFVISITLWITSSTTHVTAQVAGIDLALLINGSGSISPADFTLQKEGIKRALQNASILPRDGSVALTIIQYADATTQVHVPYTIINNTTVAAVVAQVDSIVQIQGQTNPGDGINTTNDVLNANGNPNNKQTICLSTDGLPNTGADVATALNNAKNSSIVLDKFTVIAIEDPPNFLADAFHNFYDPLVFGDGVVTVVKDAVEFANTVGGCLTAGVELVGLEVNQAIQDWNNSVELITNKKTFVRAHVKPIGTNPPTNVFARLHGSRGGTPLERSPLTPEFSPIVARPDAANLRGDLLASLAFNLPDSWSEGTIELRLESVGSSINCEPATATGTDCKLQVTFNPTKKLEIKFIEVSWTQNGTTYKPNDKGTDIEELADRLIAIFPVASIDQAPAGQLDWDVYLFHPVPPPLDLLNLRLATIRTFDDACRIGCNRIYYGVLKGPDQGGLNIGYIPGINSVASGTMPDESFAANRNTHAHEIAHVLGRPHAVNSSLGPKPSPRSKQGWCGEDDIFSAEDYPYSAVIRDRRVATIGPMDKGDNELIFGVDGHTGQIIDPNKTFSLMSYCGLSAIPPETGWDWVDKFNYGPIRTAINNRFTSNTSTASLTNPTVPQQAIDYLVVRGTIDLLNDTGEFVSFSTLSGSVPPPLPPTGDYILRLLDGAGQVVTEVSFQPEELRAKPPAKDPDRGIFIISIPANPAIKQALVLHNAMVLMSTSASSNPPTVVVTSPNGGETLSGIRTTLQWVASDADGDQLSYIVQYSADDGATWEALAVDIPNQSYDIDLRFLKGTNNGRIRVIASDGFNTAVDDSDGSFSVPNNVPGVFIDSPADNALFVGTQSIFFVGEALDREDGQLTGSNLEWSSDRDGFLGNDENFTKKATELSEGIHVITLKATDSDGQSTTASANISVFRLPPVLTADVVVSKTDNPDPVTVGDDVTYTIIVTNNGLDPADNVTVSDTFSGAGVTVQSITSSQGGCTAFPCNFGTITSGNNATITVVVTANTVGVITNHAEVNSDTVDPTPGNNSASQDTTVNPVGGAGTITIIKDAQPNSARNFRFTGDLGDFRLDNVIPADDDDFSNTQTFSVNAGVYTVQETVPGRWLLATITCDPTASAAVDLANNQVRITLSAGSAGTCTFTDQRKGAIRVLKYHDQNGDARRNQDGDDDEDDEDNNGERTPEPALAGWTIRLYDATQNLVAEHVTNEYGKVSFPGLRPGNYTVCEELTAGWFNTQPGLLDPTFNQPCYVLTLGVGKIAQVRFGNSAGPVASSVPGAANEGVFIFDAPNDTADDEYYDAVDTDEEYLTTPDRVEVIYLPLVAQ